MHSSFLRSLLFSGGKQAWMSVPQGSFSIKDGAVLQGASVKPSWRSEFSGPQRSPSSEQNKGVRPDKKWNDVGSVRNAVPRGQRRPALAIAVEPVESGDPIRHVGDEVRVAIGQGQRFNHGKGKGVFQRQVGPDLHGTGSQAIEDVIDIHVELGDVGFEKEILAAELEKGETSPALRPLVSPDAGWIGLGIGEGV